MGFIDFFTSSEKYSYRSGYLNDRKKAMKERVKKICQEYGYDDSNIAETSSLKDNLEAHKTSKFTIKGKNKGGYIFILSLLIVLACMAIYLISKLF